MHFYTTNFFLLWSKTSFLNLSIHVPQNLIFINTVNPLLSPPGAYLFQAHLRGVGGLIEMGGLFNLEMTMVSVLPKELECKVEKLKYKKC